MSIPHELVRAVREHRVVPLVGAGVSLGVKPRLFPSWRRLLEELAGELRRQALEEDEARVKHLIHAENYVQAAEIGLRALGSFRFNRFLRERFRQERPKDLDLSVPRAIWALKPRLVITTNYDAVMRWGGPLMEDGSPKEITVVANDQVEELALLHEATSQWPWLWHLHGTIERLGTLILAGSDYRRLYGSDDGSRSERYERALFELSAQLATQSFLYVGFGLSDPYVLQQIADVLKLTKFKNAPSFALMKRGEGDRAALWTSYNVQLIEYEDHGPPLAALLHEIAAQCWPAAATAGTSQSDTKGLPGESPDSQDRAIASRAMHPMSAEAEPAVPRPAAPRTDKAGTASAAPAHPAPPPASLPRPAPVPSARPDIARPALEGEYAEELLHSRRLLILSPRRGGARTLARRIAQERFGERVTWLVPPNVPSCTEPEYFSFLSGQSHVTGALELETWLKGRAAALGRDHLIMVRHDGGPLDHLQSLGHVLRKLLEETHEFFILVAGEAPGAWLRFHTSSLSVFAGAPVRHVPPLEIEVIRAMLEQAGHKRPALGDIVHRATGGLPGWVAESVAAGEAVLGAGDVLEALTERLARSSSLRGAIIMRLAEDDRAEDKGVLRPDRHGRSVLADLLAGLAVRRLDDVEDELAYAEVRLYYDGLVVADRKGATIFRCEAVRRAVERALG